MSNSQNWSHWTLENCGFSFLFLLFEWIYDMVTACKHISVGLVQGKENKTLLL
jgi:hypothetical protein